MPRKPTARPRGDAVPICGHCHQPHRNRLGYQTCTGHVTHDRDSYTPGQARRPLDKPRPCEKYPVPGLTKCDKHGAGAGHAKEAGQRRKQRQEAEALMVTLGEPVPGEPAEIVAERIAARNGHVRWLLDRVRELEPEALTWGLTKRKTAIDRGADSDADSDGNKRRSFAGTDEGDTLEAKPHIWFTLYLESARELEKLCIEAMRVGLDERRVKLAEQQGDLIVRIIDGLLGELGHNPNDPATAEIVARHLELVA